MGLFSSKKKTVVTTSVTRMVEDEDMRDSQQSAVIEYVLGSTIQVQDDIESASLTDCMRNAHANSASMKLGRLYQWAKAGNYFYGLPKASVSYELQENLDTTLKEQLERNLGKPVEIDYALLDEPNHFHFGWYELTRIHGYDSVTNTIPGLTAWEGQTCYLVDMVMHYCKVTTDMVIDEDYYLQYGVSASAGATPVREANPDAEHTAPVFDAAAATDFARITYGFMKAGEWVTKTLDLSLAKYIVMNNPDAVEVMGDEQGGSDTADLSADTYVMGSYTFLRDGVEVRELFTYLYGSGAYSALDDVFQSTESTGQYYPRIYARLDNTDLSADSLKDTEAYKSSVKAGRRLDLGWANFVGELHDGISDASNVRQAFISVALAADSKDPLIHEYMFRYFKRMYEVSTAPRLDAVGKKIAVAKDYIEYQAKEGARITISDEVYSQHITYSALGCRDVVGKVAEVGTYFYKRGEVSKFDYSTFRSVKKPYHAYFYQLTENTYREVRVYGLSSGHEVRGDKWTSASGDSANLLIPLDRVVLQEFGVAKREILHSKAMHIVFNTLKVIKTKWYQTGVFKAILFVAAVVMSVVTGGQSLTVFAVLMAAANAIALGLVLSLVAKLAVKLGINIQIVTAIAVIAMAYAGYLAINNIKGVMDVSARTLMNISNSVLNFTGNIAKEELRLIAEERDGFMSGAKEKDEAIKSLKEELGFGPSLVDPSMFMARPPDNYHYLNLYQSPNAYYNRTVHSGNPGVLCYDLISNYVEQALSLPTAQQTLSSLQGRY